MHCFLFDLRVISFCFSITPNFAKTINFLMYLFIINLFEMLETGSYVIFRKKRNKSSRIRSRVILTA